MRCISKFIYGQRLAWRLGRIHAEFEHQRKVQERGVTESERLFKEQANAVKRLKRTAAQALADAPWAAEFFVGELMERLEGLRVPHPDRSDHAAEEDQQS